MKRSIALVLVYFLLQLLATGLIALIINQGSTVNIQQITVLGLLISDFLMAGVLLYMGYMRDKKQWEPVAPSVMLWTFVAGISAIFITDTISSLADFLPDLLEDSFASIESSWAGVLAITIVGPVLEEMLFRGAITTELLKCYNPKYAIFLSALFFGIFHLNPAQILTAFLIGLLLAWLYYKTQSLWPGILVHIMNNSLAVYFTNANPEEDSLVQLLGPAPFFICLMLSILMLVLSVWKLNHWQEGNHLP